MTPVFRGVKWLPGAYFGGSQAVSAWKTARHLDLGAAVARHLARQELQGHPAVLGVHQGGIAVLPAARIHTGFG